MADVSLNGLKVKTDSLPNDWYVSIINPKDGEPAEIMTVAKFVELFTPKQPIVSDNNNGLFSSALFKRFSGLALYIEKGDADTTLDNFTLIGGPNRPNDSYIDDFHYLIQMFYSSVALTSKRLQIAFGYRTGFMYTRIYMDNAFSQWMRVTPANSVNTLADFSNALTDTIQYWRADKSDQLVCRIIYIKFFFRLVRTGWIGWFNTS